MTGKCWNSVLWILKSSLWLPMFLPLVLYRMILSWNAQSKNRLKLQDKVVLITGASSGLGEALAYVFYSSGCKVILASRRVNELERVRNSLLSSNVPVLSHHPAILQLDLSELKAIPQKAQECLNIFGRVDILVNNGGISHRGNIVDTSIDTYLKIMVINYFGQVVLTKALLPSMLENGSGHIVTISSIQGKIAIPYRSAYSTSKHALQAFFDTLRSEVNSKNIKVTVVSPGYIKTNISINALTGSGAVHGVMDSATESGMSSKKAADEILRAIVADKQEVILATLGPSIAIYIRTLLPNLYFYIMNKRAQNQASS